MGRQRRESNEPQSAEQSEAASIDSKINRRPHPLRWKRRFPHSLAVTEGVKIDDQNLLFLISTLNRAPPAPHVCQAHVYNL
jgi:hypothetical protein